MLVGRSLHGTGGSREGFTCSPSLALLITYGSMGIVAPDPNVFDIIWRSAREPPSPTDKGEYDATPLLPWLLFVLH